ncbi:MAG TPA: hypothetical protein VMU95_10110 [Trebonia sp.]|nr:hypothetical protein [Trebonia sp.]
MTPQHRATVRAPKWLADGPVSSSPMGTAAKESRSSMEEMRESTFFGTWVWSTLS